MTSPQPPPVIANAPLFDARMAASMFNCPYTGESDKLDAFVATINYLQATTPANRENELKLFLLTRISGKARKALPRNPDDLTIDRIKNLIVQHCDAKDTTSQCLAKMKAVKAHPRTTLYSELEASTAKLTTAYIKDGVPHEIAKKISNDSALEVLKTKLTNRDAKLALQIGSFSQYASHTQIK